ncbi:helix-turn-helix domain-containing protein [Rhodococcus sp. C3V]|nr:helix-turn-helix domain-containing protein [Rhodococcus sp. C3V]MDF3319978.1 helix-turn-helix domain-containing protein [Rhodococcus sp. C3V]
MSASSAPADDDDERPSILSKAVAVLRCFSASSRVMTLSDISRASGLPKSTVHRLLGRLVDLGVIERHRSGYMISLEMMTLAATNTAAGLRDAALPYIAALHRWSGRGIHLSVLRGMDLVYLESIAPAKGKGPVHVIGSRTPGTCTASGRAIMAWEFNVEGLTPNLPDPLPKMTPLSLTSVPDFMNQLSEIRRTGLAVERGEEVAGYSHIAAPVLQNNFAVAGLSLTWGIDESVDSRVTDALEATAKQIGLACREALIRTGRPDWFIKEV